MNHSSIIDDLKRALGDSSDETFAARFTGPHGRSMTRPAIRGWRASGIPLQRIVEIAGMLDSSQVEWPESFAKLYRERIGPLARIA